MPVLPFQNAFVLTGPTASGKTALGMDLAERLGAEIVSMDSMAIYRAMDIGTAKPSGTGRRRVPHHLIDVLHPWESGSVAWWLEQATSCCRDIESRGKRVLFVGGTPLYLKALLYGLFRGPSADRRLRTRLEGEAATHGSVALHARLARVDPATASRVHPNDQRRIVRALEVWEVTGNRISEHQQEWRQGLNAIASDRVLCIDRPRSELYARIDVRVTQMFADGFVEEVRALRALPRPLSREASQAVGYKEVIEYLDRVASLDETITRIQSRSRHFAKRQMTWFRHLAPCRMATPENIRACWGG